MFKFILLASLLTLISCIQSNQSSSKISNSLPTIPGGKVSADNQTTNQIYDLSFYRKVFAIRMGVSESSLAFITVSLDDSMSGTTTLGACTSEGPLRAITLNPSFWNNINTDNTDREQLSIHEFTHCFYNRPHRNTSVPSIDDPNINVDVSVMNAYFMPKKIYKANWLDYMYEIKNPTYIAASYYSIPESAIGTNAERDVWDSSLYDTYFSSALSSDSKIFISALKSEENDEDTVIDPYGNVVKLVRDERYKNIGDFNCPD
jgi:hypothetical protein